MLTLRNISAFATTLGLLFAMGCASDGTQSSLGETIDDTVITARVKTALVADDDLSASEINVETFRGEVQLSGFVSESSDIARATEVASDVPGVVSVRNDLVPR